MQQLLKLYPPSFDFIVSNVDLSPDWKTRSAYRLTAAELIRTWADPTQLIGIHPGTETHCFMLDIDRGSDYHPYNSGENWDALLYHLDQIGLNDPIFVRSSKSYGIHIYYVFAEPVNSFRAAARVQMHLVRGRLIPAPGQIEIFPNTKNYDSNYKPFRLPFQCGSELLDIDGNPLLNEHNISPETRMEYLVDQIQHNQNDLKLFRSQFNKAYADYKKLQHTNRLPRTEAKTDLWERNWREDTAIGWTSRGRTNDLLHAIAGTGIVFDGITDLTDLCKYVKTIVLASPGYRQFCAHQHHIDRRIRGWAKWCLYRRKYFPLPSRFGGNGCQKQKTLRPSSTKRSDGVVAKIQRAIEFTIERLGQLPQKLTDRLAAIMSAARDLGDGISKNTLYRSSYKHLWHEAGMAENHQLPETQSEKEVSHILPDKSENFDEENVPKTQSEKEVSHISTPMKLYHPETLDPEENILPPYTKHYNWRPDDDVTQNLDGFESTTDVVEISSISTQTQIHLDINADLVEQSTLPDPTQITQLHSLKNLKIKKNAGF
jgi:hypothetical protein